MAADLLIVGPEAGVAPFSALGARVAAANTPELAEQAIQQALDSANDAEHAAGVIFVEPSLFSSLSPALREHLAARALPVVLPLPSAAGAKEASEAELKTLMTRATGNSSL